VTREPNLKIRIGVGLGVEEMIGSGAELGCLCRAAEAEGFDSLWFSEVATSHSLDPVAALGFAAAATKRIKMGTSVMVVPGRPPALLAKAVATLDLLSGGRVLPILGLGTVDVLEQQVFGIERRDRGPWVEEVVPLLRRLWTEDAVAHNGPRFSLDGVGIRPGWSGAAPGWPAGGRLAGQFRDAGRDCLGRGGHPGGRRRIRPEHRRGPLRGAPVVCPAAAKPAGARLPGRAPTRPHAVCGPTRRAGRAARPAGGVHQGRRIEVHSHPSGPARRLAAGTVRAGRCGALHADAVLVGSGPGRGTSMTTITWGGADLVQRAIRGWNMLRLEWIARALPGAGPDPVPADRIAELRDALSMAGAAAEPVLADPRFGRWCTEVISLIERDAPRLLPAGQLRAACRAAATFTLAARFLQRPEGAEDHGQPATEVRVDHEGRIRVVGTGWVLVPGLGEAGRDVRVSVRGGRFRLATASAPPLAAEAEPAPLPGLVSAGGDPVDHATCAAEPLLLSGSPCVVIERGPDDLHTAAIPGISRVPATASPAVRARHAVAAAAQLRAVTRGDRLFQPGARVPDPPPDVAHLATAPQLTRLLALYGGQQDADAAGAEAARLLSLLAGWLSASDGRSPHGDGLMQRLARCGYRPRSAGALAGPARRPRPTSQAWRASWVQAGGTFRGEEPRPQFLAAGGALSEVLRELGGNGGIAVNTLAAGRPRADLTIDQLSLLWVRDPERYASLVKRLARPSACLAGEVILSHQAYVEERFSAAAAGYASLLLELPHDIDLWRDFAFALRHLGATRLCETVIFRLAEVVKRAEACVLDVAVLSQLRPPGYDWDGFPEAVRQVTGLLEWVSHDLNHR
jgi:hypothetical protein